MAITKTITLIMADAEENNNKVWVGELYDNGDVITRWGRVGYPQQSKTFPGEGESFLLKKEREKLKKGYVVPKTLAGAANDTSKIVRKDNLNEIARQQLAKAHPQLSKLIDRLVASNVHKITSQTNITYNAGTGLFQTPLGIVTPEGIDEARNLLVEIKKGLAKPESLKKVVSQYLMLIPQNVGMRIDIGALFPNDDAIQKQSDILDSLEASYKAVTAEPVKADGKPAELEKVFEVDLDVLNNDRERKRLVDYYHSSMKSSHGYNHIKVREIYTIKVAEMDKLFENKGRSMGSLQEVYHGTSQANVLSILKSGLKVSPPSTAYIAGKMFGNGIYGAINSSKSLGYTYGRWGGSTGESGWLFVCDFAMGKTYSPTSTGGPPPGYDSVWARANKVGLNHDELIIYKNHQVNIKYLLECK
jgi:poly [ADP-ribose] polymerase